MRLKDYAERDGKRVWLGEDIVENGEPDTPNSRPFLGEAKR